MRHVCPNGDSVDGLKTAVIHDEPMEPTASRWVVVVVRAWCDQGRLVVRLLTTQPGTGQNAVQTVVGSVEEACEALRQQLQIVADKDAG
jgi:hypothetical protein